MDIGNRIKQRRIELDISADELADMIGKSRATIYRYENGYIEKLPTTVLEPLAAALRTTPAYLMGWEDDPTDWEQVANDSGICSPNDYDGDPENWFNMKKATDDDYVREEKEFIEFVVRDGQFRSMAESYKMLNDQGKQKAHDYVSDLAEQPKYLQDTTIHKFPAPKTDVQTSITDHIVNAAHERTDIEVTDKMRKADDDIMDDDNF